MIIDEIKNKLAEHNCSELLMSSACGELEQGLNMVVKKPINFCLEIGTHNGLSAVVLTHYAKRVFTFDVALRNQEYVWQLFGVRNKISSIVSERKNLEWEINFIKTNNFWVERGYIFDFAFVDGSHEYEVVKRDFELVKHTGRVLFHDTKSSPGAAQFAQELGLTPLPDVNFSYWESHE